MATDVTETKTTEVENFEDNETRDVYENKYKENAQIDREFYSKEEIEGSRYSVYNGSDVGKGLNTLGEFEPRYSEPLHYESREQVANGDFEPPINDRGEFVPRQYEPSEQNNRSNEGSFPPGKTSTPTGHVYPSSDTELVNFRSFDVDIEQQSDRSLPLGGHKTKTQYYSVEDLIRAAKEEEENLEKADSGSDGPEVPRGYGEYEKYEPPREARVDDHPIRGSREDHPNLGSQGDGPTYDRPHEEPHPNGMDYETSRVIPTPYDVKTQRPLLVPRREKETDGLVTEDPRDGTLENDVNSGRNEDGYRRAEVRNEYDRNNKETFGQQYGEENESSRPTEDDKMGPRKAKDIQGDDEREFEESKEFYGYREPENGAEPRDDVRQQNEEKTSSIHQSENGETKEFYGYRTSKTGGQFVREGIPQYGQDRDGARPPNGDWRENQEFYGYRQSKTSNGFVGPEHEQQRTSGNTTTTRTFKESKEFYGYRTFGSSENISKKGRGGREGQTESRQFYGYRTFGSSENISKNGRNGREGQIESKEFYGYRTFGSSENVSRDSRGGRDGQIWEESKEFFGFRRRQVVDGQTHFAESGHQDRPYAPLQKMERKPLYLQSADDKRRDQEMITESRDNDEDYENEPLEKGSQEKRPYKKEPYDKRQPSDEQSYEKHPHEKQSPFEGRFYEKQPPPERRPDEHVTRTNEPENLMSVDDEQDLDKEFEETGEFYGYRSGQELPRSAAYEQYERPQSRSEISPQFTEEIMRDRSPARVYDGKSKSYAERHTRDTNVANYRDQTTEPEIKDSRIDDMYTQPEFAPGEYDPNYPPREKHMFNTLEIPSSKKVIPLVSDVAPNVEKGQTSTSETTTKRLHTRSQRDTLRREARQPDQAVPEGTDVGMKMFRQRSLPRKHGLPPSSDDKNKELPPKITKKSDEPNLSQVDPDLAKKFRVITDKRKKKAKATTKTTETTTKSAAETCNKNVEELVNVFNTLEHIQKKVDKNSDKCIPPGQVKKIVKGETLDKPSGNDGRLSPATSISHNLHKIENILDSVDKNRQRGTQRPEHKQPPRKFDDGRDERSTRTTRKTYTKHETRETREKREKHAWKPHTSDDIITKQEMPVESFLQDEPSQDKSSVIPVRLWSYTDRSPYRLDRRPRGYDKTRSRDDGDEIYQAQLRKSREESWKDIRKSRKKKYDSKSDGEIEGFKSTPFGGRVITPGTPVNIRLYGMNLEKSKEDRANNLNWELLTESGAPVEEIVDRTEKKPVDVKQIPDAEMPVDEHIGLTQRARQLFELEQFPGDEPRAEEPTIGKTNARSADINIPPSFREPRMGDRSMEEQHEPLYRRQGRFPRGRDAPIARSDPLDDNKIRSQEIKWSHPPVSKVRPDKKPSRADSPRTEDPMEVERPSDKSPRKKHPNEIPREESPSGDSPGDVEIPIKRVWDPETQEEPDGRIVEIEYTNDDNQNIRPEHSTLYEQTTVRTSTPKHKPRSTLLDSGPYDEDSTHMTHEESSSTERHESTSHEADRTIHTKRTTHTTRTETTTETIVKKVWKSGSDSSKQGEPEFRVPVRNEHTAPDRSRPNNVEPSGSQPEQVAPSTVEPEFIELVNSEPEFKTPQLQIDQHDGEPHDEPSLVAHEYIIVNNDTGRPINLTMLGRLEEDDDDNYLPSQSREDLFLHTRLKMVTENKRRTKRRPEDENLFELNPTDQYDFDIEGSITSSDDEFEDEGVPEQILIPISGRMKDEIFTPKAQVDEAVFKTDQPTKDDVARDSFGHVFAPRIVHEPGFDRERARATDIPDFESIPGFQAPIAENVDFSEKPGVFLEFGEPVEKEEDTVQEIEIVQIPVFDDISVESSPPDDLVIPPETSLINEQVAKGRSSTPTLPELKLEPVDENITSERQEKSFHIPDFPEGKPLEPVSETIDPATNVARDVSIPDLDEVLPEMRRPPTPTLIDETMTSEQKQIVIELPRFMEPRPSQIIDEDIIQSEPIKKQAFIPDFQEFIPETRKPDTPVDESVTAEKRESHPDIPEFQPAELERQASEPITEQISAIAPIKSELNLPDFTVEFQEVAPEFPAESTTVNEDEILPFSDETKVVELPGFQMAEEEPHRNVSITESDLEVEAPSPSSLQSLSTESEMSHQVDGEVARPDDGGYKAPEKESNHDTLGDETWTETHKTVKETRTTETVTVEKTITKHFSETPRSPNKEGPVSPKATRFETSIEPKDSSGSSSEPSPRSSPGAFADGSDRSTDVTPEAPARNKRRSRRGNRFDNIKRSGPLVPESVMRDESPKSNVPRVRYSGVDIPREQIRLELEQPVSNEPDSEVPTFISRKKANELRPEMYLMDSDDEGKPDQRKPDERVVAELCVPDERRDIPVGENVPDEDEIPPRDELSPELIDELLEKEIEGLEDDAGMGTSDEEPEVMETISKEEKQVS